MIFKTHSPWPPRGAFLGSVFARSVDFGRPALTSGPSSGSTSGKAKLRAEQLAWNNGQEKIRAIPVVFIITMKMCQGVNIFGWLQGGQKWTFALQTIESAMDCHLWMAKPKKNREKKKNKNNKMQNGAKQRALSCERLSKNNRSRAKLTNDYYYSLHQKCVSFLAFESCGCQKNGNKLDPTKNPPNFFPKSCEKG